MTDIWLLILAAFPVVYVSGFIHELGHAVMSWGSGFRVTSFGMGLGRPFLVVNGWGTRIYLCWKRPMQGITWVIATQLFPARRQWILMLAGGSLFQAMLAGIALGLWSCHGVGSSVWLVAAVYNGISVIINLIPWHIQLGKLHLRTDGALILDSWRRGSVNTPAPALLQMVAELRPFWKAIGDTAILQLHLRQAAMKWAALGDVEEAERLCVEADELGPGASPVEVAWAATVRGLVAGAAGKREACAGALKEAEAAFAAMRHEAGQLLVASIRASLSDETDAEQALADIDRLAGHPLFAKRPGLQAAFWESRLLVLTAASGRAEELANVQKEYEAGPVGDSSLTGRLQVYRALAGFHSRREEWPQATDAYRKALAIVGELDEQFTNPSLVELFRKSQASLVAEAREGLRRRGHGEEAEQLGRFFSLADERRRKGDTARQRRDRVWGRWGWLGLGINLVCVAVTVLVTSFQERPERPEWADDLLLKVLEPILAAVGHFPAWWCFLVLMQTFCLAGALVFGLPGAILGRWFVSWRRGRGKLLIFHALLPWAALLVMLVIAPWAEKPDREKWQPRWERTPPGAQKTP